jgi:uncharacterized protein
MKLLRIAALGAGLAAIVAFVGVGLPTSARSDSSPAQAGHTITVTGSGSATGTPNQALFTFGVSTRGKNAVQALTANSTAMRKLIDALKAAGLSSGALQTSSVSMSPVTSEDGQEIIGYSASNFVTATIANVSKAGEIVDAAVAAGANEVDGPSLSVSDQTALYNTALKNAIADARAKAQVLADASGLHVGSVASVEENGSSSPPLPFTDKAASVGAPIEVGTQQITAAVTVVFEAS